MCVHAQELTRLTVSCYGASSASYTRQKMTETLGAQPQRPLLPIPSFLWAPVTSSDRNVVSSATPDSRQRWRKHLWWAPAQPSHSQQEPPEADVTESLLPQLVEVQGAQGSPSRAVVRVQNILLLWLKHHPCMKLTRFLPLVPYMVFRALLGVVGAARCGPNTQK